VSSDEAMIITRPLFKLSTKPGFGGILIVVEPPIEWASRGQRAKRSYQT